MNKTVHFFQLYFTHSFNPIKWMPYCQYKDFFSKCLSHLTLTTHPYRDFTDIKSYKLDANTLLDIFSEADSGLYGTIGRTVPNKSLRRIRDIHTLEYVPQQVNTILEDYTFFYLDYTTGVISVLYSQGAPHISCLVRIFANDANFTPHILPLRIKDIKGMLTRIVSIASVNLRFALPPSSCFNAGGETLSGKLLNKFLQQGFEEYELTLYSNTVKNEVSKTPDINNILLEACQFAQGINSPLRKINATVKLDEESRQHTINLLELLITAQTTIKFDVSFSEETVFNLLKEAYIIKSKDILPSVRAATDPCFS